MVIRLALLLQVLLLQSNTFGISAYNRDNVIIDLDEHREEANLAYSLQQHALKTVMQADELLKGIRKRGVHHKVDAAIREAKKNMHEDPMFEESKRQEAMLEQLEEELRLQGEEKLKEEETLKEEEHNFAATKEL